MNLDLLYLIPLYFGKDIIPKFIHFGFALLTAWFIYDYLKSRTDIIYALGGALFFLSTPIIVKLSITAYVDLGVIFFSAASLLLLLKWLERGFELKFLILSAICCGLAMGTKYNGLILCILLSLFAPFLHSRYGNHEKKYVSLKSAGWGLLFFFIALLLFSPWMIKNYIWTQNPIYPLCDAWFNPGNNSSQGGLGLFGYRGIIYKESWWEIVLLPLRVFIQGQDGNAQYFDGRLNPFLLFLPFLAFLGNKQENLIANREKKILVAFSVLYFLFALFSAILRIRYLSPIIMPLVLLSVYGMKNLFEISFRLEPLWKQRIAVTLFFGAISIPLLLNAVYIHDQFKAIRPFEFLSGTVSRDEYIARYRPEYSAMEYINKSLPQDAKVLFIFMGNRGYYCEREYVFDMKNYRSTLLHLIKDEYDPQAVFSGLRSMGVTHLLMRNDIFYKWVNKVFKESDRSVLRLFMKKYVVLMFKKEKYRLYRLERMHQ
jgi:hypothetical protein